MPKLFSSAHIAEVLQTHGFAYVSQRGSHVKFQKRKNSKTLIVIVPANKKEIPTGTLHSILRQSQLTRENFE